MLLRCVDVTVNRSGQMVFEHTKKRPAYHHFSERPILFTMKTALVLALAVLCLVLVSEAAMCSGKPNPDALQNLSPIQSDEPVFVSAAKNAKLFTIGQGDNMLPVVHLFGSPYDMGFAHGTIRNTSMRAFLNDAWTYLQQEAEAAINGTFHHLKPWFVDLLADFGLEEALDLTLDATKAWTGDYYFDEMQGMADSTKVDIKLIKRIHMIAELTKGACSMFGAGPSATVNHRLIQLRALDWDVDGPFKNYAQITVYHPDKTTDTDGQAFANIGFTGFVGSVSGVSSEMLSISEIGVSFPDSTFGGETRFGVPFVFLLRDILQFDQTLGTAMSRIRSAHRTCDLILGVGDGKTNEFRAVQYSASVANFFDADNMMPEAPWHQRIPDVVYYGMDWLCPAFSQSLHDQLQVYSGRINVPDVISNVTAITQTGNLHVVLYDYNDGQVYVATARADGASGPKMAYDRPFVSISFIALFNEQPPSM
jgi:isopenicillin-N N-acyltransferase-like protein